MTARFLRPGRRDPRWPQRHRLFGPSGGISAASVASLSLGALATLMHFGAEPEWAVGVPRQVMSKDFSFLRE